MKAKVHWKYFFISVAVFLALFCVIFVTAGASEMLVEIIFAVFPIFMIIHAIEAYKIGNREVRSNIIFCSCIVLFSFVFMLVCLGFSELLDWGVLIPMLNFAVVLVFGIIINLFVWFCTLAEKRKSKNSDK